MTSVTVEGLTVEYPAPEAPVRALAALDLAIDTGTLVVLMGPSGSGKTTLLSCLAGILTPTAGSMRVGDVVVSQLDRRSLLEYRRRSVGIVFQAFNLMASLTAIQNVMAPLLAARVGRHPAAARAEQLLVEVGLQDRLRHRPGALSGGQQQRVAIARALAHDPPLLLADEPTAHLDSVQVEVVAKLLRRVVTPGRSAIVATHDPRLFGIADHVVDLTPVVASMPATPRTAAG